MKGEEESGICEELKKGESGGGEGPARKLRREGTSDINNEIGDAGVGGDHGRLGMKGLFFFFSQFFCVKATRIFIWTNLPYHACVIHTIYPFGWFILLCLIDTV